MKQNHVFAATIAGLSLMLISCSSEAAGSPGFTEVVGSGSTAGMTVTAVSTEAAAVTETVISVETAAPVTETATETAVATETSTQPEIDPGIGNGDPSSTGGKMGSCFEFTFIDDSDNYALNGHEFLRLCNQEDAEGTIALQYIFDGVVQDEEFLNYQYAQAYQLKCGLSGLTPVCLVEVEDSSGKSFYGDIYTLVPDGQLQPVSDSVSSTVEMTMVSLPQTDPTDLSLMLVAGLKFRDLGTSEADAPVGYQTWALSPDMATLTGCTPAYSPNYPELPTEPATGPCDASAEVIDN